MRISDWRSDVFSSDLGATTIEAPSDDAVDDADPLAPGSLAAFLEQVALVADADPVPDEGDGVVTLLTRSEERRRGTECVSTCRSRWSADNATTNVYHAILFTHHTLIRTSRAVL